MADQHESDSRELGLELGLLALRCCAGTDELHYGLWDEDLPVRISNIAEAQRRYTEYVLARIPPTAQRVLDVGCGAGVMAEKLLERGHEVECVSPSRVLAERTRERVGDRARLHCCRLEDLEPTADFDLVLFSESFQYIPMPTALAQARRLLHPAGQILICDFFRTEATGREPMGGGHRYRELHPALTAAGLRVEQEEDLTPRIAPTLELYEQLRRELIGPGAEIIERYARRRHPWSSRLVAWLMRRKLMRFQRKYLSGERNAEAFRHWKTYRLLRLAPAEAAPEVTADNGSGLKAFAQNVVLPLGICLA